VTFQWPALTVGTVLALVVLIVAVVLAALGRLDQAPLLVVAALCALKL
jgi:hypothetical protein